jgi:hypothetical protein
MLAYARPKSAFAELNETELFSKIQSELVSRYTVDEKLASEMAWDLIEVLSAVDGDIDIFEKYFLH